MNCAKSVLAGLVLAWSTVSMAAAPVSLDDATVKSLASLEHVSTEIATSVVDLRAKQGGHIAHVDELRVVRGMTPMALESLRSGTTVSFALTAGANKEFTNVEQVLGEFKSEPTVLQVQAWTNDYARTSPAMVQAWNRAATGMAALPKFRAEYRLDQGWGKDYDYEALGDAFDTVPRQADQSQRYYVKIFSEWQLSKLVMSSERIRVINEAQDTVKLRDKLLTQVTRLYFDRRRHQVEILLNPRSNLEGQVEDQLRLLELTAGIDALTGGQFSRSVRGL